MNKTVSGILLLIGAMAVFAVLDSTAKLAMRELPQPVTVFFRYFIALWLCLPLVLTDGGRQRLNTQHPYLQALRGILLFSSTASNFIAVQHLQLAQTSAINFTIPLWVCALSVPFLGEKVSLKQWLAVLAGFAGVIAIMRPGTASFHWAMLVSLGTALMNALYNITTRKVGSSDAAETSLLYATGFGCLASALPLPWGWHLPQGSQWLLLAIMGASGAAGHFMLIQAHRMAPASVLAPFTYTQIVWMIAAGFVLFGNLPDGWTLLGAAAVVSSGAYVYALESRRGALRDVADTGD